MLPLFLQYPAPSFQAYFADAGAGVVSTSVQGMGNTTATFTRASTAYTLLSNGLYGLVASGSPRSYYSPAGVYLGYLTEGARADVLGTTAAIRRTMTDAGWVNTTMTVGAATGVDGVASAGASLTAGGANSTSLFTTVLGAAVRTYSAWVRRKTGTGTVNITGDNGVTWTAITLTAAYQQFQFVTASAANPVVGFRIVTNTDAIEVDFNTLEAATFANPTPIPVNVSKAADLLTYPTSGNMSSTTGTAYVEFTSASFGGAINASMISGYNGGEGVPITIDIGSNKFSLYDLTAQRNFSATLSRPYATVQKVASAWATTVSGAFNGVAQSGIAWDGSLNLGANFAIGGNITSGAELYGTARNVRIYPTALTPAQLQAMTT